MQILKKLHEIRRALSLNEATGIGITSPNGAFGIEERPKIEFPALVEVYEKDAVAGFVIDATVKAALGIGYHYTHDGTSEGEEQVRILEEWNNSPKIMMRGKNIQIGAYMYGMGFCPVEPVTPDFLDRIVILPLKAQWSLEREPRGGGIKYYHQRLNGLDAFFTEDEIIPFTMNANPDTPLGRGVLQRLLETTQFRIKYSSGTEKTMTRFSLFRAKGLVLNDLVKLIHNGVPKTLWRLRIKDSLMSDATKSIQEMDAGQRYVTNAPDADIKSEMTEVKNGFSKLYADFGDEYNMALQSFLPKFFGQSPWTESAAITAERVWYNALVQNLQDSFRETKATRIDDLILQQNGFDENHTEYHWGMPKGPFLDHNAMFGLMSQITSAFQAQMLSQEYAYTLFNQVLQKLGDVGIAVDTKPATPENMGVMVSDMAKAVLDGNVTNDSRKMAEEYLKFAESLHGKHKAVIPRRIAKKWK